MRLSIVFIHVDTYLSIGIALKRSASPLSNGPNISPNVHPTSVGPNVDQFCVLLDQYVKRSRHITKHLSDQMLAIFVYCRENISNSPEILPVDNRTA